MIKKLTVSFILFLLVSHSALVYSQTITDDLEMSLTLREAIGIAHKEALKWNENARLLTGFSVDKDETQTGMDGRRKHWNIQFGIPYKTDWYLVTIRDGKVGETAYLPDELDRMPESHFISGVDEFNYDTLELLQKGQKLIKIYPGDIFAKGYNFGFTKDPQKNIPLVMIIGWDEPGKNMIYLMFNAVTGELEGRFDKEQYKNNEIGERTFEKSSFK